jgi:PPOX class probable F420-dependent enzyme
VTPDEARQRFAESRVAHLATADADGVPHLVPITFAVTGDRIVTAIDAKPKRGVPLRRIANVTVNPRVSVLVDRYDEDWTRLWWVRADGSARVVIGGADLDDSVARLRERYPQYRTVRITGPVIMIEVVRWSGWNASAHEASDDA